MDLHRREPQPLPEAGEDETLVVVRVIEAEVRQVLELLRSLIGLVLPKEGDRSGPTIEQLLTAVMAQQRELIGEVRSVRELLVQVAEALPQAVAEAVVEAEAAPTR